MSAQRSDVAKAEQENGNQEFASPPPPSKRTRRNPVPEAPVAATATAVTVTSPPPAAKRRGRGRPSKAVLDSAKAAETPLELPPPSGPGPAPAPAPVPITIHWERELLESDNSPVGAGSQGARETKGERERAQRLLSCSLNDVSILRRRSMPSSCSLKYERSWQPVRIQDKPHPMQMRRFSWRPA